MALKPWLKGVLAGLGVVLAVCIALVAGFVLMFVPFPPEPDYPPPASLGEAYRQDLDYLRRYVDHDRSFDAGQRTAFLAALDAIESRLPELTPARFELDVARAVALADNAHTNVSPISRLRRVNTLPVRFYRYSDGVYIVRAKPAFADLLGARVDAIEGRSPAELIEALLPSFGGPANRGRWIGQLNLESPALLHAANLSARSDGVTLTLTSATGATLERFVPAMPPFEGPIAYGGQLLGYTIPQATQQASPQDDWQTLMTGRTPPLYLAEPDRPFSSHWLDHAGRAGLYLKLDMTMDVDGYSIDAFHQQVVDVLEQRAPWFVIVDLRHNGGGTVDADFARRVVASVAPDGRIFTVTSSQTFSGGITEAAYFKHFAGARGSIIGEPVGDRLVFWANGGSAMVLPNSRIPVNVWSAKEDWADGCTDWSECFWPSIVSGVAVGTLEPDIPVALSFADYIADRDPVMDRILAEVARGIATEEQSQ